jgi:2-polyprenyl-3-methyl-5-hydroxy-6-metoxy-1,4-benzoquinol methylase
MYAPVDKASYWEDKYNTNQTGWDTSSENPVFSEFLFNSEFVKPGKILIAGCGNGYDAVAAAKNGYNVTAVDFSSAAINCA